MNPTAFTRQMLTRDGDKRYLCGMPLRLTFFTVLFAGCSLHDPPDHRKARYAMAIEHAARVLREAGTELSPTWPDYEVMTFYRRYWDESTEVMHRYELYDFVKICDKPGPARFVIAYDVGTRETYLRANLRSNHNLDRLPTVQSQKPEVSGE